MGTFLTTFFPLSLTILSLIAPTDPLLSSDILIFHHIPKNAGTTVTKLLDKHFEQDDILKLAFYYELDETIISEISNYKFVRGHFFYHQLQTIKAKKIVFLREPVQRTLSEHRFYKKYYPGIRRKNLFKEHFLPEGDPLYTVQNHQCLFLSSLDPRNASIPISAHLKSAKFNLANQFFFVGITEDLERSLKALYFLMGWPEETEIPKLQSTDASSEIYPDNLLEQIRERNWADIELYNYAKDLYSQKLKEIENSTRSQTIAGSRFEDFQPPP